MNLLQGLSTQKQYFVTVNRAETTPPDLVICEIDYTHPIYTLEAQQTQKAIQQRNGNRNTWFCGAYLGYGFHEDGCKSGVHGFLYA